MSFSIQAFLQLSATVVSVPLKAPVAGWGWRSRGGCLYSWHVFISRSAALFVPEYSIAMVQFQTLIKQTEDLRLSDNYLISMSVVTLAGAQVKAIFKK